MVVNSTTSRRPVHTSAIKTQDPPRIVIFYNIYIKPPTQRKKFNNQTIVILDEQLDQIVASYAGRVNTKNHTLEIHYATIGYNPAYMPSFRSLFTSRGLISHHLEHFDAGFEEVTLQHLWDYCTKKSTDTVIYIHNKGSLHNEGYQAFWRKNLLSAVTSEHCLERPRHDQCNVCGLQFYPIWTQLFPGNFFSAKCHYIRKLYPPADFERRLLEISTEMRQIRQFQTTIYSPEGWTWGEGRQAAEHWVGSHASLVPCDVAPYAPVKSVWRSDVESVFSYHVSPRRPLFFAQRHMLKWNVLRSMNATARDREYYLLGGSIYKWESLYNELPDPTSWVWNYYPDGGMWKSLIESGNVTAAATAMGGNAELHDEAWLQSLLPHIRVSS